VSSLETDGIAQSVGASAEVILCVDAFGSPQLLMRSGIGDATQLKAHDI
jgi:choline dehydrogenase-like flavoprotein